MNSTTTVPATTVIDPSDFDSTDESPNAHWWVCPDWCNSPHRFGAEIETATGLAMINHEKSIVDSGPLYVTLLRVDKLTLQGVQSVESYVAYFAEEVTLTAELARDMAGYLNMAAEQMAQLEPTVASPTGRTIRPDDLDMQTLCNGDQHAVGGSISRADFFVTAVK
jgi:hypothetical protein